jgi:YihY family inner membrane protein
MSLIWLVLGGLALFTAFVTGVQAAAERLPVQAGPFITSLSGIAWQSIFVVASIIVTVVLFTLLYKILPNTHVPLTEALPGAMIAGGLWEGAKFGVSLLLPYFHYDLLYGSLGAVVALITWVYLSSLIMLFGAQFTALVHREHLFNAGTHKPVRQITENS